MISISVKPRMVRTKGGGWLCEGRMLVGVLSRGKFAAMICARRR